MTETALNLFAKYVGNITVALVSKVNNSSQISQREKVIHWEEGRGGGMGGVCLCLRKIGESLPHNFVEFPLRWLF